MSNYNPSGQQCKNDRAVEEESIEYTTVVAGLPCERQNPSVIAIKSPSLAMCADHLIRHRVAPLTFTLNTPCVHENYFRVALDHPKRRRAF